MAEITLGLLHPGGFHHAAAEIYQRLEGFKEPPEALSLEDILASTLDSEGTGQS